MSSLTKRCSDERNSIDKTILKSQISTCNILGVHIATINMGWLVNFLSEHIKSLSGQYICVTNVHTTVMSYEEPEYCAILNNGIMAIPDGGPLSTIGRKKGHVQMERTTGPDLMGEIFQLSSDKGYRHYFYGSTQSTLEKLSKNLMEEYPHLNIVGMYSPPFRPLTAEEDEMIVKKINETNADFVWVGLGAPKQERWMASHKNKINGLMIGVGAGFDYYAKNIARAPQWMQRNNLEWLYRLMQNPRRLFKRYFRTNIKFLWLIGRGK